MSTLVCLAVVVRLVDLTGSNMIVIWSGNDVVYNKHSIIFIVSV